MPCAGECARADDDAADPGRARTRTRSWCTQSALRVRWDAKLQRVRARRGAAVGKRAPHLRPAHATTELEESRLPRHLREQLPPHDRRAGTHLHLSTTVGTGRFFQLSGAFYGSRASERTACSISRTGSSQCPLPASPCCRSAASARLASSHCVTAVEAVRARTNACSTSA
eukprot:COSAG01_NODE_3006_length_6731_cov_4.916918_5_plen_171_part_00